MGCLVRLVVVRRQGLYCKSSGETVRLSFPFADLLVPEDTPRLHCSEAALQFAENMTFMFLWRVYTGNVREQSKMSSRCRRSSFIYRPYNNAARTEPWGTLAAISLSIENSPSIMTLHFLSLRKKQLAWWGLSKILILTIYRVCQSAVLCRRLSGYPRTQHPSTFCCWNLEWLDPTALYIEVSYCDLLESQTDLHLISFFAQCVLGVFLKSASQIVCPSWTRGWLDVSYKESSVLCRVSAVMIFASFQGAGKWPSRSQWFSRYVKCTRDLLGRRRRH
jgi:hypothetical protein